VKELAPVISGITQVAGPSQAGALKTSGGRTSFHNNINHSSWGSHFRGLLGSSCWVWEPEEQKSEYPIPCGDHYEPCTLRRGYKSAFLHPARGDTGSHKSATGLTNKMLSKLFPPVRGKQTSSSKRAHACESMASDKNPPNPYPNPELKHP
jgi:hypothetical protein